MKTGKYIVISTTERNNMLLTDEDNNNVFPDKNTAKQALFEDFSKMFAEKTGKDITYEEFLNVGDDGSYDYGVDDFGENAWINDVYDQNYDVNLVELEA